MKKIPSLSGLLVFAALSLAAAAGPDDLLDFVNRVNEKAASDIGAFTAKVGELFRVPVPKVEEVLKAVARPADAYMAFKVAEVARKPPEVVVKEYQANKDKGWGVIAKNLGIKPGSAEFHALKKGGFEGDDGQGSGPGGDKAKGKEKEKGGKGKGRK